MNYNIISHGPISHVHLEIYNKYEFFLMYIYYNLDHNDFFLAPHPVRIGVGKGNLGSWY